MNKCRRIMALMARRLSRLGYGVLLFDLYGTGDSEGDFADARWDIWLEDVSRAHTWLRQRHGMQTDVLALRLGALLAVESCVSATPLPGRLVLWQPVAQGDSYLTQFLRLRLAAAMMDSAREKESTRSLRQALAGGQPVEVAGYLLAPALAEAVAARQLSPPRCSWSSAHWIEVGSAPGGGLSPASQRAIDAWKQAGLAVQGAVVAGEAFWTTPEITVVPGLLEATEEVFGSAAARGR
jgi:exosortase A-associated hydrolase 2